MCDVANHTLSLITVKTRAVRYELLRRMLLLNRLDFALSLPTQNVDFMFLMLPVLFNFLGQEEVCTSIEPYSDISASLTPRPFLSFRLEQITGIEPATSAWEANILPLNYICVGVANRT